MRVRLPHIVLLLLLLIVAAFGVAVAMGVLGERDSIVQPAAPEAETPSVRPFAAGCSGQRAANVSSGPRNNESLQNHNLSPPLEDRLFARYPKRAPFHHWLLRLQTGGGLALGTYHLRDAASANGVILDLPVDTTELFVELTSEEPGDVLSRYRVAPEAPGTVRKWVVRIPSSKIILVPSGPLETDWFQATYEGVRINGSLYDGDAWDGSPIQAEVFPGTYTLSGYIDWRYAYGGGDKAEPPDEMTARVQFDPPVVEASEGQEITAVVSIVVYKAWLPVDVGGGTIRRVWALSPGGIRIAPELARYWPEDLVEVDQGKASRVRGWHLTSDGQLFVAPDEAGTREEIAVGPFAVVELEDGNYVVFDANDRDPALGGTILPDSTTHDDPGIDIQVAYEGESPPASVELYLTFTRTHRSESAKPHALTFRRQLKVPMGQSRFRVPRGFTCWITDVVAKSGSSWKRVVSPAEEKESIFDWTSYGGGLTNGDSLTVSLQD